MCKDTRIVTSNTFQWDKYLDRNNVTSNKQSSVLLAYSLSSMKHTWNTRDKMYTKVPRNSQIYASKIQRLFLPKNLTSKILIVRFFQFF